MQEGLLRRSIREDYLMKVVRNCFVFVKEGKKLAFEGRDRSRLLQTCSELVPQQRGVVTEGQLAWVRLGD